MPNTEYLREMANHNLESGKELFSCVKKEISKVKKNLMFEICDIKMFFNQVNTEL